MTAPDTTKGYVNPQYTTDELVEYVKAYALDHYNDGGWDVIVEAYDDDQIREMLGQVTTREGALKKARWLVRLFVDVGW